MFEVNAETVAAAMVRGSKSAPVKFDEVAGVVKTSKTAGQLLKGDIVFTGGQIVIVQSVEIVSGTIIRAIDAFSGRPANKISNVVDRTRTYTVLSQLP